MTTALAIINSPTIQLLPPRLAFLVGAISTVQHPGQAVRLHLPASIEMTEEDREAAKALSSTLTSILDTDAPMVMNGKTVDGNMAKGALLTKMIKGLAGKAKVSDIEAAAKMELYRDGLEGIPAWSIDKAIKRWARGECPYSVDESPNYDFPPSPATLRKMALFDMEMIQRNASKLKALLETISFKRALDPEPLPVVAGGNLPVLKRM